MEHFLREKSFENEQHIKKELDLFFESQPVAFYERGIRMLPDRWEKVIINKETTLMINLLFVLF